MKHLEAMIKSLYTNQTIKDCAGELNKDKNLLHTKMSAGNLILDNHEKVQVQITITRSKDEDQLLEDFQMETMIDYSSKL